LGESECTLTLTANSITLILASFVSSDPKSQAADQPIKIVVEIPEKVIDLELERKPGVLPTLMASYLAGYAALMAAASKRLVIAAGPLTGLFVRLVIGQDGSCSAAGLFQSYWQWYQRMDCPTRRSSIPDILALSGVREVNNGHQLREFCFGYLMVIDTACSSLSDCGGKPPDSAQRSASSFVLSSLASFFTRLPE
jgi:hypothetical protein